MKKPGKGKTHADPTDPPEVKDALRQIRRENEDLNPGAQGQGQGPGAPPEGAAADLPGTTTHTGQTTRGSYATDSSTGTGRYMDRTTGTFGMEPLDPEGEDDAIDQKN